jgi:hypothetical protein
LMRQWRACGQVEELARTARHHTCNKFHVEDARRMCDVTRLCALLLACDMELMHRADTNHMHVWLQHASSKSCSTTGVGIGCSMYKREFGGGRFGTHRNVKVAVCVTAQAHVAVTKFHAKASLVAEDSTGQCSKSTFCGPFALEGHMHVLCAHWSSNCWDLLWQFECCQSCHSAQ